MWRVRVLTLPQATPFTRPKANLEWPESLHFNLHEGEVNDGSGPSGDFNQVRNLDLELLEEELQRGRVATEHGLTDGRAFDFLGAVNLTINNF